MPRGSSREFRTKYSGAAAALGISGGVENRLVDSGFIAESRGAFESQGFAVSGRNVSQIFQQDADQAQAELGLSAFSAQTQSIDFDKSEILRNSTQQLIGIAREVAVREEQELDGVQRLPIGGAGAGFASCRGLFRGGSLLHK